MPKTIKVAVVTNADGTHLDQFLPSLAGQPFANMYFLINELLFVPCVA